MKSINKKIDDSLKYDFDSLHFRYILNYLFYNSLNFEIAYLGGDEQVNLKQR